MRPTFLAGSAANLLSTLHHAALGVGEVRQLAKRKNLPDLRGAAAGCGVWRHAASMQTSPRLTAVGAIERFHHTRRRTKMETLPDEKKDEKKESETP
jgi:hypothetical protein